MKVSSSGVAGRKYPDLMGEYELHDLSLDSKPIWRKQTEDVDSFYYIFSRYGYWWLGDELGGFIQVDFHQWVVLAV